jgi:hypothetical protein
MTWGEFQKQRDSYKQAWEELKKDFSGPIRAFLEQSRIIVSCGREFEINANFDEAFKACPAFFFNNFKTTGTVDALEISDGWRMEIKFSYVDIDFIQEIKASPYCDKEKTLMRPSSVDVVILKESTSA